MDHGGVGYVEVGHEPGSRLGEVFFEKELKLTHVLLRPDEREKTPPSLLKL